MFVDGEEEMLNKSPSGHPWLANVGTFQLSSTSNMRDQAILELKVEDYHEIIKVPMDFVTMRAKLHEGLYTFLEQFNLQSCIQHGIYLISGNAMHINLRVQFFSHRSTYKLPLDLNNDRYSKSLLHVSIHGIGVSVAEVVKVAGNVLAKEDNGPAKNLRVKNQFKGYDPDLGYNGVLDGAVGGVGYKEVVAREGLEEEALVEFIVEWFGEDEDGKKNGKDDIFN
uniref:Bromo domain-containing protein n=1 Tax=Tanacetum cinerariifolium TaxID=118510 RepID=A0A6L2LWL6_TANCI|nr:hypothetical protein [Tanacetum cinerariifolium]